MHHVMDYVFGIHPALGYHLKKLVGRADIPDKDTRVTRGVYLEDIADIITCSASLHLRRSGN